ncbi:MAG: hypothetical protein ACRC6E_09910 [Fusobacteriaceae bacterium]
MKIVGYELHVETYHSLGAIFTSLKSKGLDVDLKLCEHNIRLTIKAQNGTIYEFEIKLYEEYDGMKVYEIKAYGELEMNYIRDVLKTL